MAERGPKFMVVSDHIRGEGVDTKHAVTEASVFVDYPAAREFYDSRKSAKHRGKPEYLCWLCMVLDAPKGGE